MSSLLLTPSAGRAAARMSLGQAARMPVVLAAAMMLVILYAAFSHGGGALATDARIEVALAGIAAVGAAGGIWAGAVRLGGSIAALAGLGLLCAFALWSALTLAWSVAPDQTWTEANRAISYAVVLGVAIGVGRSYPDAVRFVARGFVLIALAVCAYALGQKVLPGLRVPGLFDLNQTGPLPRLQEPLGYWNALALFAVLGLPPALATAVDRTCSAAVRLGALVTTQLMVVTVALTYSRGGVLAGVVALVVLIAAGRTRLRSLMWLAMACGASVPPLVLGLTSHALTTANVSLGSREGAGAILLALLLVCVVALVGAGWCLQHLEETHTVSRAARMRIVRGILTTAAVALAAAVIAIALSHRGLPGTISHAWNSFTTTHPTSNYDPARLLSADSENRWVWWKEAAGAFGDRPIAGWGAGSFAAVHLLYRRDTLSVAQPHSVPLQFLAETGLIGAVLGLGALALLLVASVRAVQRLPDGSGRLMASALLAAAIAYTVHSCYDWDWDIPAVTLPALVFLGVLGGAGRALDRSPSRGAAGRLARGLAAGAATLILSFAALSAALPSFAADKAESAIVLAASPDSADVAQADVAARVADRLDPLSDAGLRVEATIALRQGRTQDARTDLTDAVGRDPADALAWSQLMLVDYWTGNPNGALQAARRALALDPMRSGSGSYLERIAELATRALTPPRASATRRPLPSGG